MSFSSSSGCDIVNGPSGFNDNILINFGDKFQALQGLLLSFSGGCEVVAHPLNLSQYYYEDLYLKLDQSADTECPLHYTSGKN